MPKPLAKNKLTLNPNFVFILAVSSSYIFTISKKNHPIPRNAGINVVTIANENYDAVVCPTGSTDATCTHFGAKGMQTAIDSAPTRNKDNPFKIYVKSGEYTDFISKTKLLTVSNTTKKHNSFFYINNNIYIKGSGVSSTVFNGLDTNSDFFVIENTDTFNISDLSIINIKNNIYTDSNINSSTGCLKTVPADCYFSSGYAFLLNNSKNYDTNINLQNLKIENTSGFLYTSDNSQNNVLQITKSLIKDIKESALDIHSNTKITIKNSEFLVLSTANGPFEPMRLHNDSDVSFLNSVIFWINQPASSCVNMWNNSKVLFTNSLLSNCQLNGISMTNTAYSRVVNTIIQNGSLWGVRAYENSNSDVLYSFIYNFDQISRSTNGIVNTSVTALDSKISDNPQIVFNPADYFASGSMNYLPNSRSINSGSISILNIDGTRSSIGPAGGPDACLLRSYFPGCNGIVPTVSIPTPTPINTIAITPTIAISPTIKPSSGVLIGDMDGNKMLNVNDILLLIKEVFK